MATISLDLGLTVSKVQLTERGVIFSDGQIIDWKSMKKVYKHNNRCYLIEDNEVKPIIFYSEKTGWVRTLYPTKSAPTTLVSGILMHRIKDIDPVEDTRRKIKTLNLHKGGVVLDTATGLGYSAIEAAKYNSRVTTIELDPSALEVAKLNPWSKKLFNNPDIIQIVGDIQEEVCKFESETFTHIIHDPPTFKIAGELYSSKLYKEFFRILKNKGILFHYIGDPNSKHGSMITKSVLRRLKEVGFVRIKLVPEAFGLVAFKS